MSLFAFLLAAGRRREPVGQVVFSSAADAASVQSWIVPPGVTRVHAVVVAGSGNTESSIKRGATVLINHASAVGATFSGGNGGARGTGTVEIVDARGGGGAGGYTGAGGAGGICRTGASTQANPGSVGAGGAGGGGGGNHTEEGYGAGGGGVGLLGQGISGAGGTGLYPGYLRPVAGGDGSAPGPFFGAGCAAQISSYATQGGNLRYTITPLSVTPGETLTITTGGRVSGIPSSSGGVRIMWGGGRSYPYNAADLPTYP